MSSAVGMQNMLGRMAREATEPYHIVNIILVLLYPVIRFTPLRSIVMPDQPDRLTWEESQILLMLGAALVIKSRKQGTADAHVALVYLMTKVAVSVIFFRIDQALFWIYGLLCLAAFVFVPQPSFKGEHNVKPLTPQRLKNLQGDHRDSNPPKYLLVNFYVPWAPACQTLSRDFFELSTRLSSDRLTFAKLNLSGDHDCAREYNIAIGALSKQLPTLVLFENGKEIMRRPDVLASGKVNPCRFSQAMIEEQFCLNDLTKLSQTVTGPSTASVAKPKKESKKSK